MESPAAAPSGAQRPRGRIFLGRLRRAVTISILAAALALVLVVVVPVGPRLTADEEALRAAADAAVAALKSKDLGTLNDHLEAYRADPAFASVFALAVEPRDLGDAIASVVDRSNPTSLDPDTDTELYNRVLGNLAGTLALATQAPRGSELPSSWSEELASAITDPDVLYVGETRDEERVAQDIANRQNLLLLVSRGLWSTDFLMTLTASFWEWEQTADEGTHAWPGVADSGAGYAPGPSGEHLEDGMVALLAALTANPEAAGWAFTEFQSSAATIRFDDADHTLNEFTHHLFFEHEFDLERAGSDAPAGSTTAVTALMSAIQATGGSHSVGSIGPQSDAYVLQDYQQAVEVARREQEEWEAKPWHEKARAKLADVGRWLKVNGPAIVSAVGAVPVVGIPADIASVVWSAIRGNWVNAGLSAIGIVPVWGDATQQVKTGVQLSKFGNKVYRKLTRDDEPIDLGTAEGRFLVDAADLGGGVFDFRDADDFLAALEAPLPGVTYKYGATAYELAPNGTLTHLGGPDRTLIAAAPTSTPTTSTFSSRELARGDEEAGLEDYGAETGVLPDSDQVLLHLDGVQNGRYFDGLALKSDGTYEGVDVVGVTSVLSSSQATFDGLVSPQHPATGEFADGEVVMVTSVRHVQVAR